MNTHATCSASRDKRYLSNISLRQFCTVSGVPHNGTNRPTCGCGFEKCGDCNQMKGLKSFYQYLFEHIVVICYSTNRHYTNRI